MKWFQFNLSVIVWFLSSHQPFISARPLDLEEQNQNYYKILLTGFYEGYETLLSLMGFDEDDDVKTYLATEEELKVGEESEENQTTMKLVGLGLGRTGTTSLVLALEILGYRVIHDDEHPTLTDLYAALEEEDIDMDEMHEILGLRGYNATFKTAGYKWVERHPEVKAILTVRDNPDKFVDSWLVAAPFMKVLEQRPFCWMPTVKKLLPSFESEFKIETTGGRPEKYLDRETLRKNYDTYIQTVQDAIPDDRLLTFNVKQGWEPLCKYLGHPIPEGIPFPHVHTRAKLQGEMNFLYMITWIWPLGIVLPMIVLAKLTRHILSWSYFNCQ